MRGEGCTRELDVQLALHEVSTAQGGGHKSLQTLALQPAAREQEGRLPLARRCLSQGSAPKESRDLGHGSDLGCSFSSTCSGSNGLGTRAAREGDDPAACEKQQAAAPYLAPVPGRGGCSILVAQGRGVGCAMSGGARVPRAAAAAPRTRRLAPLAVHPGAGRRGGLVSPRRCAGRGGAVRGPGGRGARAGAAPGGRAGHRVAPAAAAAAADPAPGPGAS